MQTNTITIKDMQLMAYRKGGKCLSSTYVNSRTKLEWQCSKGHVWETSPNNIHNGSWCPHCVNLYGNTLDLMKKIAADRGGECLSECYINLKTKLQWRCLMGHIWNAQPRHIKNGTWCPVCAIEKQRTTKRRYTIEDMQKIANERGGNCLSTEYVNTKTDLLWECDKGHQWNSMPNTIIYSDSWCPTCAGNKQKDLEDAKRLAIKYGGKCLSDDYINSYSDLEWECSEGHRWRTAYYHIKKGRWCKECYIQNSRLSIEDLMNMAEANGGKCLTTEKEYKNVTLPIEWECSEGHRWYAPVYYVQRGRWCKKC